MNSSNCAFMIPRAYFLLFPREIPVPLILEGDVWAARQEVKIFLSIYSFTFCQCHYYKTPCCKSPQCGEREELFCRKALFLLFRGYVKSLPFPLCWQIRFYITGVRNPSVVYLEYVWLKAALEQWWWWRESFPTTTKQQKTTQTCVW